MSALMASGRLIDLIIAFTVLEIAALWLYHRLTRRGLAVSALLPNLLAGLCLMLALRASIAQAPWYWVLLPVAASGFAHALDLRGRLAHKA